MRSEHSPSYLRRTPNVVRLDGPLAAAEPLAAENPLEILPDIFEELTEEQRPPVLQQAEARLEPLFNGDYRANILSRLSGLGRIALHKAQLKVIREALEKDVAEARQAGSSWREIGQAAGGVSQTAAWRWWHRQKPQS